MTGEKPAHRLLAVLHQFYNVNDETNTRLIQILPSLILTTVEHLGAELNNLTDTASENLLRPISFNAEQLKKNVSLQLVWRHSSIHGATTRGRLQSEVRHWRHFPTAGLESACAGWGNITRASMEKQVG